jgi:hypothetical protein
VPAAHGVLRASQPSVKIPLPSIISQEPENTMGKWPGPERGVCADFRASGVPSPARPKRSRKGHLPRCANGMVFRRTTGVSLLRAVRSTPLMLLAQSAKCPPPRRGASHPDAQRPSGPRPAESGFVRPFLPAPPSGAHDRPVARGLRTPVSFHRHGASRNRSGYISMDPSALTLKMVCASVGSVRQGRPPPRATRHDCRSARRRPHHPRTH